MDSSSDAAETLGVGPGVSRVPPLQNDLDTAPHLAGGPGVGDLAPLDLAFDNVSVFQQNRWIPEDADPRWCSGRYDIAWPKGYVLADKGHDRRDVK